MGYFDGGNQTTNDSNQTQDVDYIQKVVAEKGEQWQDPKVLAKGYLASQEMIEQLKKTQEELREDLGEKNYTEKLLEELRKGQGTPPVGAPNVDNNGTTPNDQTGQAVSEDQLKGLIEATLTQREAQNTSAQNLASTEARLSELYGTEVEKVVAKRAQEVGMTKEQLKEIASQSPTAFLKLIGESPNKENNPTKTGSVNTAAEAFNQSTGLKDAAYWRDFRRKNPAQYYTASVQQQVFKARKELGEKFGS